MDSILATVKKSIGIFEDDDHFDPDLIVHINSVFQILKQLGVGPVEGFRIEDATAKWKDCVEDETKFSMVKTYIGLKVKLLFDPPQSTALIESMERLVSEMEWRLNVEADTISKEETSNDGQPADTVEDSQ